MDMTIYSCLNIEDMLLFFQIADFTIIELVEDTLKVVSEKGKTFQWILQEGTSHWCLDEGKAVNL